MIGLFRNCEICKSNNVMHVKLLAIFSFSYAALLTGVIVSGPGAAALTLPVCAVIALIVATLPVVVIHATMPLVSTISRAEAETSSAFERGGDSDMISALFAIVLTSIASVVAPHPHRRWSMSKQIVWTPVPDGEYVIREAGPSINQHGWKVIVDGQTIQNMGLPDNVFLEPYGEVDIPEGWALCQSTEVEVETVVPVTQEFLEALQFALDLLNSDIGMTSPDHSDDAERYAKIIRSVIESADVSEIEVEPVPAMSVTEEHRQTILNALKFSRDSLAEHADAHIAGGADALRPELDRHDAAIAYVEQWQPATDADAGLDWPRAKAYLDLMQKEYEDIGDVGRFGLALTIMPLQDRLAKGERTKWLYDEIMEVA